MRTQKVAPSIMPGYLLRTRGVTCRSQYKNLNVPDVLGPHHARAELTYGAVWMR